MGTEKSQRQIVRMFPDYADTVLWFGGPVAYRFSGLTPELVRGLKDWEQSYYDSLTPDLEWKSAELVRQFTEEGEHLARRVADELGDGYEVELKSYEQGVPSSRFRGTRATLNPRAATAFDELTASLRAELRNSIRSATSHSGEAPEWFAYAPLPRTSFKPDR